MKTINIIKILGIIGLLFLLPSISNAQIQRVWNIPEYTSTIAAPPATGAKVAYRTINNSLYYWNGSAWVRIAGPGIIDTTYSLSFSSPILSLLGSGSSVSLTNLYTAGYGLIKTAETWRADTTSPNGLATRLFAKTLPSIITSGQIAYSNGSNLVGSPLFTINTTRPTLTIGSSSSSSTTTPSFIDMGGTFSSVQGANPKLALYNSGGVTYGFGISAGQLDYITPISGSHSFYIGGSRTAYINSTSIRMPTSKTIKFDAAGASATTPMIDMSSGTAGFGVESGYLTYIAPTWVGHNFYVNGSVAARITSTSNLLLGTTTDIPTSILTARSTTKSSSPFPFHTTAESNAITGVNGNFEYITDGIGPALSWYNGTRKAYGLESTFARGTSTRIPFFDANGQVSEVSTLRYNHVNGYLYTPNFISPKIETYPDDVYFVSTASSNRIRFYTPAGTDNILWFYVNNVYKGSLAAGNTQFSINHLNAIYISQQGGTLPYIQVGGTGTSIGIGTTVSPSYHLHIQGTNAIGLPRGTVGNQPGIVSNTTPMRFFTDTAAIGYGDGGVYNFVATRAYARTMKDGNGIISALPSGNVSISEQTRDLRLGLRGFYVDSIYLNSESVPYNTIIVNKAFFPAGGITATTGNSNTVFNGLLNGSHGGFGNYAAHGATITANSSGSNFNNAQGVGVVVYGAENQAIGYNITTGSSSTGRNTMHGRNIYANNFNSTILIGDSLTATTNGQVKIGNSLNNSQLFFGQKFIYDYDTYLLQLSAYGTPATTAPSLSKTESGYVASFTTDGTVTSFKLARDTFIEDVTLFSVGTLLNSCQELTVVSSMTATAPSHQEIRFPDAADHLRGKKIIVYQKKKEAGIYVPQIKVVGGVSRLYFTTTPGIGGTDPSDQSTLSIDDSTWSSHGTTFEFTCLRIDNTPSYRWVLKQR